VNPPHRVAVGREQQDRPVVDRDLDGAAARTGSVFLRLGLTTFGGPTAHIAMMEDEAVVRRKWLTRERFLDPLGVAAIAWMYTRSARENSRG
jgi:hypothetical protein